MNLGQEIDLVTDINVIGRPNYHNAYSVIAGSYLAVNAYAQNISNQQLTDLQQRLDTSKTKLEATTQLNLTP